MESQTGRHDAGLIHFRKGEDEMHLAIGADGDGIAHRLQEGLAAVRIGIACRIVCVRADVDIDLILLKEARRERGRRREHESVAERHIGRDLALSVLGDLLRIALVDDLFGGACEEGAVRILKNGRKIKFVVPYMVVRCDLACRKDLFLVLLPIKNRSSHDVLCSQSVYCQRDAGGRVHAAAGEDNSFFHLASCFL